MNPNTFPPRTIGIDKYQLLKLIESLELHQAQIHLCHDWLEEMDNHNTLHVITIMKHASECLFELMCSMKQLEEKAREGVQP